MIGLSRQLASAASFLVSFEALHPEAIYAALGAARMEVLWVALDKQRPMASASQAQWAWLSGSVTN